MLEHLENPQKTWPTSSMQEIGGTWGEQWGWVTHRTWSQWDKKERKFICLRMTGQDWQTDRTYKAHNLFRPEGYLIRFVDPTLAKKLSPVARSTSGSTLLNSIPWDRRCSTPKGEENIKDWCYLALESTSTSCQDVDVISDAISVGGLPFIRNN